MVYVVENEHFRICFESHRQFADAPVPRNQAEAIEYCEASGVNVFVPDYPDKMYPGFEYLAAAAYTGTPVEWKD